MRIPPLPHRWKIAPKEAIAIQRRLAGRIICRGCVPGARIVAGADVAFSPGGLECIAGVVAWDVRERAIFEHRVVRKPVRFPYVPGLLSFRETPALLAAIRKLKCEPDVFMFDGQGFSHPRRFGLASHAGLLMDRPAIGCAKSLLIGEYGEPGPARGSKSPLIHNGEVIGMAIRTRDRCRPVFVSVGHRISLNEAVRITLACCGRYRMPEPTRLADILVSREKRVIAGAIGVGLRL